MRPPFIVKFASAGLAVCAAYACADAGSAASSVDEGDAREAVAAAAGPDPTAEDFLVQDVCASATAPTIITADDPIACPPGFARRNLFPAESMPYHKTDVAGVQLSDSFALRSPDLSQRLYVSTMDFTQIAQVDGGSFLESNRAASGIDGWNIAEARGPRVSFVGTQDGSGVYQEFIGPGCRDDDAWTPDDAWVLMPNAPPAGAPGAGTFPMFIRRADDGACRAPAAQTRVRVTWEGPFDLTYTTGKTLSTVKSYHQVSGPRGAAWEVFFFTREYGLTRWEAWTTDATPTRGHCNGPLEAGGLKRGDCRDWTRVVRDPTFWSNGSASGGGYSPYAYNVTGRFVETNRLRGGDFGGVDPVEPHWARLHGNNGALTHWNVGTHVLADWDTSGVGGPQNVNHDLTVTCGGACDGNVVYQDARDLPAHTRLIEYGVTLWSDAPAPATVAMFAFDAAGAMVAHESVPVDLGPARASLRRALPTPAGVTSLRFAVYPSTGPALHLDDAWAVPK